ncbi:hypothetical protein [Rhodoferax mekongensis]|uniref:EcsC family protein n=1 Tax=Rhodoferax mekongensis TaxID=3068341 RepID=A0ABZ0AW36_9BURK|nr:hypothetical protein [Rhodoferax sp. TBRC 17307]WNO03821.1 hypothetical protein RAN89_12960 [Rhodoferax sp. TBRC 17307]
MPTAPKPLRVQLASALLDIVVAVPESQETVQKNADVRAHAIARKAARQASMMAATLSLPPGWMGWLTVVPEMVGVWKIQAQMVADIAALHGKQSSLGKDQMLYCLFKHVSAQLFRDFAVRAGERAVVRSSTMKALEALALQISGKLLGSALKKSASRWIPLAGAVGVGAYAYYDTLQVAKSAHQLFAADPQ